MATQTPPRRAAIPTAQAKLLYFFEARVDIDRERWRDFERRYDGTGGQAVVDLMEEAGLILRHSGRFEEDASYYRFYNIWELGPNANMLAEVERRLADKVLWADFIKLLERGEIKDICYPLTYVTQPVLPPGFNMNNAKYLRIEYDIVSSGNSELQARLEANLRSTGAKLGWLLGNSYLLHTGMEGRMVQMWLVPGELTLQAATKAVSDLPWISKPYQGANLFKNVGLSLFARSPFDHDPLQAAVFNVPR